MGPVKTDKVCLLWPLVQHRPHARMKDVLMHCIALCCIIFKLLARCYGLRSEVVTLLILT